MATQTPLKGHPEYDTGVTLVEILQMLADAEQTDWENADRFSMLAWMELSVSIFQRMAGEPETPVF